MKTAEEMRKLAEFAVEGIINQLEQKIQEEAQKGATTCSLWFNQEDFGLNNSAADTVVKILEANGYKVGLSKIYDQRDGDTLNFSVSWGQEGEDVKTTECS